MASKAVLFDLDDTLLWDERSVKESFQVTCTEAAKLHDEDTEQLEEAFTGKRGPYTKLLRSKMIGINPFEGLWGRFDEGEQEEFRKLKSLVPSNMKESWTRGLRALGIENEELCAKLGEMFRRSGEAARSCRVMRLQVCGNSEGD